jgi:hypothetical protein
MDLEMFKKFVAGAWVNISHYSPMFHWGMFPLFCMFWGRV